MGHRTNGWGWVDLASRIKSHLSESMRLIATAEVSFFLLWLVAKIGYDCSSTDVSISSCQLSEDFQPGKLASLFH